MPHKKLLVTGANGMLGSRIVDLFNNLPGYEVFSLSRSGNGDRHINCDLSDGAQFSRILELISPNYVIHCAANVNLESCEREKEYSYKVHVISSRIIASNPKISKSIYISTDSVFDGVSGDYKEADFVAPLNYYAITKAIAEESFINATHPSIIIRTNIFGFQLPLKKSLFEWGWNNLSQNLQISGFSNIQFNPLYVNTLAEIISKLLSNDVKGIVHTGCINGLSKYEFLVKIADLFNFQPSLVKESCADNSGFIRRPLNTVLNCQKVQQEYGIEMPNIDMELSKLLIDFKRKISLYDKRL